MAPLGRLLRSLLTGAGGARSREAMAESRALLERALRDEAAHPGPVHPEWAASRARLRSYLLEEDFSAFLRNKDCKRMFFRTGWTEGQDHEVATLRASEKARTLLEGFREPRVGRNPSSAPAATRSD